MCMCEGVHTCVYEEWMSGMSGVLSPSMLQTISLPNHELSTSEHRVSVKFPVSVPIMLGLQMHETPPRFSRGFRRCRLLFPYLCGKPFSPQSRVPRLHQLMLCQYPPLLVLEDRTPLQREEKAQGMASPSVNMGFTLGLTEQ